MPLPVLLVLVVGGIGGVVLLLHFMGWSSQKRFTEDSAAKALLADFPDARISAIKVSDDGLAAICLTQTGIGLVAAMGIGDYTRIITANDVESITDTGAGLTIALADFTAPKFEITLKDPAVRQRLERDLRTATEDTS